MAHQIDPFCVHHLADTECLEADHQAALARLYPGSQARSVMSWLSAGQHTPPNVGIASWAWLIA